MLRFECDYGEGAAPAVLELLQKTNFDQTPGYGEDEYCAKAAAQIKRLCDAPDADVHFFVGATQANLTVIAAALKPWQGVLCADSGHIHVHETGSIEATGHKCLALPGKNGKITARQIRKAVEEHRANASHEHEVQPGMVYISNPTEVGTLYNKEELTDISAACYELGLYLFVDGARMAYGLTSPANDLSLQDYAALCDVFYLGGTKCGALFGEAVVIANDDLKPDFRYCLKQHGGMLAKGRLLGEQFLALLDGEDGSGSRLYFTMAKKADEQALRIRAAFEAKGCKVLHDSPTNQQFFVLPDEWYDKLAETYAMTHMGKPDKHHTAVRVMRLRRIVPFRLPVASALQGHAALGEVDHLGRRQPCDNVVDAMFDLACLRLVSALCRRHLHRVDGCVHLALDQLGHDVVDVRRLVGGVCRIRDDCHIAQTAVKRFAVYKQLALLALRRLVAGKYVLPVMQSFFVHLRFLSGFGLPHFCISSALMSLRAAR